MSDTPAASTTPEPIALLVNLEADQPKGAALRRLLREAGIPTRDVGRGQMSSMAGYLAGLPGFAAAAPYEGEVPDEEFLLLCNLPDQQVLDLMRAMRAAGVSVGCKATLTEHSKHWPFIELMREVCEEHAAMEARRAGARQAQR